MTSVIRITLLIGAVLFVPFIIMPLPFYDYWIWVRLMEKGDLSAFWEILKQSGNIAMFVFHLPFFAMPNPTFFLRLTSMAFILLNAYLLIQLGNRWRQGLGLYWGFVYLTLPFCSYFFDLPAYHFFVALFLLGTQLSLLSPSALPVWKLLFAMALFGVSFSFGALLVVFGLWVIFRAFVLRPSFKEARVRLELSLWILLPLAYWVIKSMYFPSYGRYAGYNSPRIDPALLGYTLQAPLLFAGHFWEQFKIGASTWVGWLGALGFAALARVFFVRLDRAVRVPSPRFLFPVALALIWAASLPYVLVGQLIYAPEGQPILMNDSVNTRHEMGPLFGIALLIGGIFWHLFQSPRRALRASFVFAFSLYGMMALPWQVERIYQWGKENMKLVLLIKEAKKNPLIEQSSIILFADQTLNWNAESRYMGTYDFTGVFFRAFGDEKRFGHYLRPDWPNLVRESIQSNDERVVNGLREFPGCGRVTKCLVSSSHPPTWLELAQALTPGLTAMTGSSLNRLSLLCPETEYLPCP